MSFISDWFTFGFDPDFDEGVRAFERGDDRAAADSFRKSMTKAVEHAVRERATNRLIAVLMRAGNRANHNGDVHTAKAAFSEAVKLRPMYADLRLGAAWAYYVAGEPKLAANEAQAALAINPENGQARALMGLCVVCLGSHTEGFEAVAEGLAAWPTAHGSLLNASEAWKSGSHEAAVSMARSVRPPVPLAVDAQIAEGDAAMRDRRWEVAEAAYKAVLNLKPRYADVWTKLGQCHLNLDDYERAAEEFREAVSINNNYAQAWALLGVALRRSGYEEPALEAFRKALAINSAEPIATHEMSRRR